MKTRRSHFMFSIVSVICALTFLLIQPAAAQRMDQRSVAIGPDGTTYIISQRMDMMGGGVGDQGMELTLYAVGQDNRVLWSYRLEAGEPTAPVVGTDGTVYVVLRPMGDDHDSQNGLQGGPSTLYAIRWGNLKWSYEVEQGMPSAPALGPGGTIYLTTTCSMMLGNHDSDDMDRCEQNEAVALFALEDQQTSAALLWARNPDAIMLSEPVVHIRSVTDWTISVSGLARDRGGMGGGMMGTPVLFRFNPDGSYQTIRLARGGRM